MPVSLLSPLTTIAAPYLACPKSVKSMSYVSLCPPIQNTDDHRVTPPKVLLRKCSYTPEGSSLDVEC